MSFENKTTDELLRIAKAGLGFTIDKDSIPAEDIDRIVNAAAKSGAQITFIDSASLESNALLDSQLTSISASPKA